MADLITRNIVTRCVSLAVGFDLLSFYFSSLADYLQASRIFVHGFTDYLVFKRELQILYHAFTNVFQVSGMMCGPWTGPH